MKCVCTNCGWCDDESEFFWHGRDIDDFGWNCPNCGKDDDWIEEAVRCDICEEWMSEDDLIGGICLDCFYETAAKRQDIVTGFLWENKECFGEYAAEIEQNRKNRLK